MHQVFYRISFFLLFEYKHEDIYVWNEQKYYVRIHDYLMECNVWTILYGFV